MHQIYCYCLEWFYITPWTAALSRSGEKWTMSSALHETSTSISNRGWMLCAELLRSLHDDSEIILIMKAFHLEFPSSEREWWWCQCVNPIIPLSFATRNSMVCWVLESFHVTFAPLHAAVESYVNVNFILFCVCFASSINWFMFFFWSVKLFFTLPNASEGCKLKEKPFTARKLKQFFFPVCWFCCVLPRLSSSDKNWINLLGRHLSTAEV